MKKFRGQKGFTLIEVLIVVIIIAILATLGIARFLSARGDAESSTCDANLASLNAGIAAWRLQNPGDPVVPGTTEGEVQTIVTGIAGGANPLTCPSDITNDYIIVQENSPTEHFICVLDGGTAHVAGDGSHGDIGPGDD